MIETAKGLANVVAIASQPSIEVWHVYVKSISPFCWITARVYLFWKVIVLGCNDLSKDLKVKCSSSTTSDRKPLHYSMSQCVVAARAAQKKVIDGVFMDITNPEGLSNDCLLGKDFGFDGKSLY